MSRRAAPPFNKRSVGKNAHSNKLSTYRPAMFIRTLGLD